MNTEVRRNIFCVIMTSEDYLDAFEKLLRFVMNHFISGRIETSSSITAGALFLKHSICSLCRMGLKDKQEREIVHVLMDCCLQEKTFNAYYAVLGEKFCSYDRRFQVKREDRKSKPAPHHSGLIYSIYCSGNRHPMSNILGYPIDVDTDLKCFQSD